MVEILEDINNHPVYVFPVLTWGLTNNLQEAVLGEVEEDGTTKRRLVICDVVLGLNGNNLANPGDSGALAFTGDDSLVGILLWRTAGWQ